MLSCGKMTDDDADLVIWGITTSGTTFRPSDWADRLAGLTSAFGPDQKLVYSPLVLPVSLYGMRALIVGRELAKHEPRLFQFFANFARDNALRFEYVDDALATPDALAHPLAPVRDEPRQPV